MSTVTVRNPCHRTIARDQIVIGERVRGIDTETLDELTSSIQELGLLYPVLIDEQNHLVDGLRRLAALDQLGVDEIPVIIDQDPVTATDDAERLRRELAANGVRTQYTPVQAAAARRRLRELVAKPQQRRTGAPLAERRKNWASELAVAETGVSRTTMDRVDQIVRVAEDVTRPMHVRREAAEGLTRIDVEGVPVHRVLQQVTTAARAADAVAKYPALASLPTPDAQATVAAQLDALPADARQAQLEAMSSLFGQPAEAVSAYRVLSDVSRIEELIEHGEEAVLAAATLTSDGHLTEEQRHTWTGLAARLETLAAKLREALTEGTHP